MAQERDNLKAGLFVVVGIVLALAVVFTLADFERLFERRRSVQVRYQVSDGLQGLKEGAIVTLGDQPVGEVLEIEDETDATGRVESKLVTFSIPARYKLFQDAVVELKAPPLGSGTKLNVRSVGQDQPYDGSRPLVGARAGSELMRELAHNAGIEDAQREQIQAIIANVEKITQTLQQDLPEITMSLRRTMNNVEPLTADAREAVANLRGALDQVKSLTTDLRDRSGVWMDRLDGITGSAQESLARVNTVLKDKEPDLRQTVENIRDVSRRAKEQTMAQVTQALERASAAMDNLKNTSEELRGMMVAQRPVLERAIANAQLTSDQLKLAAIEVRRSPWRLLYTPKDKELESDNLYDAARSFAQAAGALDAAAQSLAAVRAKSADSPEQVQKILDYLEALFQKFEQAENEFWTALKNRAPAR